MPTHVTQQNAAPDRTYRLRDRHPEHHYPLTAWDTASREWGLCDGQSIAQHTLGAEESLICCVEGPPATVFTLCVTRLAPFVSSVGTGGPPPIVRLDLCGGAGRAASRIMRVDWTAAEWLSSSEIAYVFQATPRLCSSWWLYGSVSTAQGPAPETIIAVRLMFERATVTELQTTQLGPGVVVVP